MEERPAFFTGTVVPVANNRAETLNVDSEQSVAPLTASENALTDLAFSLFAPQEAAVPADLASLPETPYFEDTQAVSPVVVAGKTAAAALSGDTEDTPPAPGYSPTPPPRPAIPQAASKTTHGLSGQHFYD